jgi:GTP-binding protein HflX
MIEVSKDINERAMLVAINKPPAGQHRKGLNREITKEHIEELEQLAFTAGAETKLKVVQDRPAADPAYYLGKGKAEELVALAEDNYIDIVIFDDDLSPVQMRNLEKLINRKVVDRSGLILHIFATRAKTKEAKTQVELAQLEYMLPRLTRQWTHLSKQYGGIRTKGPGETQIETDRRMIRQRISYLKEKLEKIESQRKTQSQGRKDFTTVSLVGYTNAGKTTLFNLLTHAGSLAEDKLFATLDSTTRSVKIGKNQKLLLSDTVGFIRKLPAHLIASFKSTLNEVRDADIILHLVDISHPYFEDHIVVVENTLKELGAEKKNQLKIFNKVDIVEDKNKIGYVRNKYKNSVIISAARGINITSLRDQINKMVEESYIEERIDLDLSRTKTAAEIHSLAEVLSTRYDEKEIHITYRTNKQNSDKIKKLVYGR